VQEFLLRMRRSVLKEAVVEFDIIGKSCSLFASSRRFLIRLTSHIASFFHVFF